MATAGLGPCCPMAAPMVACFGFHGHCWPQALLPHGCPHGGLLWLSWPLLASSLAAPWLPPWWLALAFMATAGLKPCCPMAAHMVACIGIHGPCWAGSLLPHGCPHGGLLWLSWPLLASSLAAQWLPPWWLALACMAPAGLGPCCPMAAPHGG